MAILQHTAVRGQFLKHHEVLLDMQNNKVRSATLALLFLHRQMIWWLTVSMSWRLHIISYPGLSGAGAIIHGHMHCPAGTISIHLERLQVGEIVRSALESPELQEHFKNCCPANEPPSRSQAQVEKLGAQIRKQLLASGALCEVEQQLQEAAKAQKQGAGRRVSWRPKDAVQQKQPQLDEIMGYCFRNQEWQAQALTHPCALAAIVGTLCADCARVRGSVLALNWAYFPTRTE